jgi:hypothetical protein
MFQQTQQNDLETQSVVSETDESVVTKPETASEAAVPQEDLLTAALRAVEESRKGSRAASPQAVLVNAILW